MSFLHKSRLALRITLVLSCLVLVSSESVYAVGFQEPPEITNREKAHLNIAFTGGDAGDVNEESPTCSNTGGNDVEKFLKALALQESGGDPKAQNPGSSASGKYQYIDSTWVSRVTGEGAIYPPGGQYTSAKDAPEAVQDAVAYIEYAKKFQDLGNDLFKLAVSHFYPAANSDASLLDAQIGSNTITPREYAESVLRRIQAGEGSGIPLTYTEAPEYEKYQVTGLSASPSDCAVTGDLPTLVKSYAWPEYHEKPYVQRKPAYIQAIAAAKKEGKYIGGCEGVDCGGFVTTLLNNSGFDPEYNYAGKGGNTTIQESWAKKNWQNLGSGSSIDTATLQPGDVAFSPGHTFVYIGNIEGFGSNIASASLCGRAPMAGAESLTANTRWYRKKT